MNNKKNTDIISIVQNRYRRELAISVAAPIEDVRKTFEALSETGMYAPFCKFEVRCYDKIVEIDGPSGRSRSVRLMTKATLEQRLDGNGTTINLSIQIPKEVLIDLIVRISTSLVVCLIYAHIYMNVNLWSISILYIAFGFALYQGMRISFDTSVELLVDRLQEDRVWNGLGSQKPSIKNLWGWREKK
jgi:hypothetical protein